LGAIIFVSSASSAVICVRVCLHRQQLVGGVGLKRRRAGDEVVERRAERVDIGAVIDGVAAALLGRHVEWRAGERRLRDRAVARPAAAGREPEVQHLGHAMAVGHEVRRLDVAVGEPGAMGFAQPERGGADHRERFVGVERAIRDALGERLAGDVLHREVQPPGLLADEVDVRDVRVCDPCLRARLADHAIAARRIAREVRREHLDRDRPIEREIGRQVDLTHPAGAERLVDPEVAELLARGERARSRGSRRAGGRGGDVGPRGDRGIVELGPHRARIS
jgi:hypothetical protein